MKATSKYNLGDFVFILHNDKIQKKVIRKVRFPSFDSEYICTGEDRRHFLKPLEVGEVHYGFYNEPNNSSTDNIFTAKNRIMGSTSEVILCESRVFKTKEELIASL